MANARNWFGDLYPASFKGVPFWTEQAAESGGRRIVKHVFPNRDPPFLEDLGEALREFSVTAYLASNSADAEAAALTTATSTRGAGILVIPDQGPVLVRCYEFERTFAKDRLGYIAYTLKCTREGYSSPIVSVLSLANLIFVAAENAGLSIAASFAANFQVSGLGGVSPQPIDFVVQAAGDGLQTAAATLEAVRSTTVIDPDVSSAQRAGIQALYDGVPAALETTETVIAPAAGIIAAARALGDGMQPATAIQAFEILLIPVATSVPYSFPTQNARVAIVNAEAAARTLRLAALTAYCEAIARVQLTDRPQGITLRANVADYFEAEIIDLPASEIDLVHQLSAMRDNVVDYISRAILDLSPVIHVETNLSMPSLAIAWRLYQDPTRSTELVARNRVAHPSFMPTTFEALAR